MLLKKYFLLFILILALTGCAKNATVLDIDSSPEAYEGKKLIVQGIIKSMEDCKTQPCTYTVILIDSSDTVFRGKSISLADKDHIPIQCTSTPLPACSGFEGNKLYEIKGVWRNNLLIVNSYEKLD